MWGKKCGSKKGLCPFSFGLALGITAFLAILIWSAWMMVHGVPPEMATTHVAPATWGAAFAFAFLGLVKGFIFGFVVALLYDLFSCCCKASCCRSGEEGSCECGCGCSACDVSKQRKLR